MAKLQTRPFIPPKIDTSSASSSEAIKAQLDASWAVVQKQGELLSFPVADGNAIYIVRSIHPPVLQWVDWMDGYRVDDALIRGLRACDIEDRLAREKALNALFEKAAERTKKKAKTCAVCGEAAKGSAPISINNAPKAVRPLCQQHLDAASEDVVSCNH